MNELRRMLAPAAVLTGLLAVDIVFRPMPFGLAFRAWLVALGGLAAAALVRGSLGPYQQVWVEPVRFQRRRLPAPERPPGLEDVERAVDFAAWNPADFNRRLRPLLREVAAHRLQSRRGIDIDRDPRAARQLLGEVPWALVDTTALERTDAAPVGGSPLAIRETIQRLEDL
jgi:hypothetical protein